MISMFGMFVLKCNNLDFGSSNAGSGISIYSEAPGDDNETTSGNFTSFTVGGFVTPQAGSLTFTTTINSELGSTDIQSFSFDISIL